MSYMRSFCKNAIREHFFSPLKDPPWVRDIWNELVLEGMEDSSNDNMSGGSCDSAVSDSSESWESESEEVDEEFGSEASDASNELLCLPESNLSGA